MKNKLPRIKRKIIQKVAILGVKLLNYLPKRPLKIRGFIIKPCEHVFFPGKTSAGYFFVNYIAVDKGDVVLDVGCGTGILSIASTKKASRVVAVDISKEAVACTQKNVNINHLEDKVEVMQSDLFKNLGKDDKFDLVIFNPPLLPGKPKTKADRSWFDYEGMLLNRFFKEVSSYLKSNGKIQISHTSTAFISKEHFEELISKYGFIVTKRTEEKGILGFLTIYTLQKSKNKY